MGVIKVSSKTQIKGEDFIKKVMVPATGKTASSILKNYDAHDELRTEPYRELQGAEIPAAAMRYKGKLNMSVAEERIKQIDQEQRRVRARKMEWELETHGERTPEMRGEQKKAEFENMRAKQAAAQKAKLEEEAEKQKKRNIERTRASENQVEDMQID